MSGNYFLYSPKLNDSTNIFKENISIVRRLELTYRKISTF